MMDQRRQPRISVKSQCLASFNLGAKACRNIAVTNLAADGCCLLLAAEFAGEFMDNSALAEWRLTGPDLPQAEVRAKVIWIHGEEGTGGPHLKVGIRFVQIPGRYRAALADYIGYVARTGIPAIDYTGMPA
jgi:hypothetical protein